MANTVPRLVLIGTVHRDRQGEERLRPLLEELAPGEVTLEMSPPALRFRTTRGVLLAQRLEQILDRLASEAETPRATLAAHPAVEDIRDLLAIPFEYRAARAYADAARIPLALIDLPEISARKLRLVEAELITRRNLRILTRLPDAGRPPEESYATARALVLGNPVTAVLRDFLLRRRGEEGIGKRDELMAAALRRRLELRPGCTLVHIGGWVHLVDDPLGETLYSRLRDLAPERRLLA